MSKLVLKQEPRVSIDVEETSEYEVGICTCPEEDGGGIMLVLNKYDGDGDLVDNMTLWFPDPATLQEFRTRLVGLIDSHLSGDPQGTC